MFDNSDVCLGFEAVLISDEPEDKDRFFLIQYFLSNKTIQILEKKNPKKGIEGKRFLMRMNVKDPRTGEDYGDDAFYVGAELHIVGRVFEITGAAEYTLAQMEAHSDRFKQSDLQYAIDQFSGFAKNLNLDLKKEFEKMDSTNSGTITEADARNTLYSYIPNITKQIAITILRRFVKNGSFDYSSLVKFL